MTFNHGVRSSILRWVTIKERNTRQASYLRYGGLLRYSDRLSKGLNFEKLGTIFKVVVWIYLLNISAQQYAEDFWIKKFLKKF